MQSKNEVKKNENEELNQITCPSCFSKLVFKTLNKNEQIFACSNEDCLFPLDSPNMNKYIININSNNLNVFLSNLKNIISEHSSAIDTNIEEKLKKYEKPKLELQNDELSDIAHEDRSFSNFLSQNENDFTYN